MVIIKHMLFFLIATLGVSGIAHSQPLDSSEVALVVELRLLIAIYGPEVWPGWTEAPPLLLRKDEHDYLIGHPAPPEGFERMENPGIAGSDVSRLEGHLTPGPVATAWPVGELWSLAMPVRDEFQAAVDAVLGPGVVVLDDPTYLRALVHEAFHANQLNTLGDMEAVPRFEGQGSEREALAVLMEHPGLDAQHTAQGQALARALEAPTAAEALEATRAFLELRLAWQESLPEDIAAFEKATEWLEGMARYADTRLMMLAANRETEGLEPYPAASDTWQDFITQLENPTSIPGTVRDRYFVFGAAQGFLLERFLPHWQERVLPGGEALQDLLDLLQGAAAIPEPLRTLDVQTVSFAGTSWRVARADTPEGWTQGLSGVTSLGSLDGLLFVFPEDVTAPFWMKGAVMPLDIAFFAEDGELVGVEAMPLCLDDPCPSYRPTQAYRYALEAPLGMLTRVPVTARLELGEE